MELSNLLNPKLIFLDQQFENFSHVLTFISEQFSKETKIPAETICEHLIKREKQGITFVGNRLSLPHARFENLNQVIALFIRMKSEISVRVGNHSEKIKYVFAVLAPEKKASLYLKTISTIIQLVKEDAYVLDNATSPVHLIQSLQAKQMHIPEQLLASDLICTQACVEVSTTLSEAVNVMRQNNTTFIPACDDSGILQGVVDIVDLFRATFPENVALLNTVSSLQSLGNTAFDPIHDFWVNEEKKTVKDIMRPYDTYTVFEDANYVDVVFLMTKFHYHHLIVIDKEKKVKGIIDTGALIHKMIRL